MSMISNLQTIFLIVLHSSGILLKQIKQKLRLNNAFSDILNINQRIECFFLNCTVDMECAICSMPMSRFPELASKSNFPTADLIRNTVKSNNCPLMDLSSEAIVH